MISIPGWSSAFTRFQFKTVRYDGIVYSNGKYQSSIERPYQQAAQFLAFRVVRKVDVTEKAPVGYPRIGMLWTCNKSILTTLTMECIRQQQKHLNSSTLNAPVKVEANYYGSTVFVPRERMICISPIGHVPSWLGSFTNHILLAHCTYHFHLVSTGLAEVVTT